MVIFQCLRNKTVNRRNFNQFLGKISKFPSWIKIILSKEIAGNNTNSLIYLYTTYRPILTYKGNCELDSNKTVFDRNLYNILELIKKGFSLCEISMDTYLTLEEISSYFLLCLDSGFIEKPENSSILNLADFLAGKTRTGEFLSAGNIITKEQLSKSVDIDNVAKAGRKFGQILVDSGFAEKQYIENLFEFKEDSKKRFIIDHNEIPESIQQYAKTEDKYQKEIEDLKSENKKLKTQLNQLLLMVKTNDK